MNLQNKIEEYGAARLARDSGLTPSMISYVKSGKRELSKENAEVVASILGMNLEDVLSSRCKGCRFLPVNK